LSYYTILSFFAPRRPPSSTLFPPRRSSDLEAGRAAEVRALVVPPPPPDGPRRFDPLPEVVPAPSADAVPADDPTAAEVDAVRIRSEEHTSELQSRENLVCRLLLEKKKDNTE